MQKNSLTVADFADTQMKQFSRYDCERSLPSVIDGLKITQRKVLFTLQNGRENFKEIKVAQLGSYTSAETNYHHGEQGVSGVIINMAKKYPGTNNLNLLEPIGQFGSQLDNTSASARYIFTRLSSNFRLLFNKLDNLVVNNQYDEDGVVIEPEFYIPLIPPLLVNGSSGVATGFACEWFPHNPKEITEAIISKVKAKKPVVVPDMLPYFNGWKGTVETTENPGQYLFKGIIQKINTTTLLVTEWPIGMDQTKFTSILVGLIESGMIKNFEDNSNEANGVSVTIDAPRTTCMLTHDELMSLFKLVGKDTRNMTAWISPSKLRCFESINDVLDFFIAVRLEKYEARRLILIDRLSEDMLVADEIIRFIELYISSSVEFSKMTRLSMQDFLKEKGFVNIDVLMNIKIYNLTADAIKKSQDDLTTLLEEITLLSETTPAQMYLSELQKLLKTL